MQEDMDRALSSRVLSFDRGGGNGGGNSGGGGGSGGGVGSEQSSNYAAANRGGGSSASWRGPNRRSGGCGGGAYQRSNPANAGSNPATSRHGSNLGRVAGSSSGAIGVGGGRKENSEEASATAARELGRYYADEEAFSTGYAGEFKRRSHPAAYSYSYSGGSNENAGFFNKEVYMQANCQFVVKAKLAGSASSTSVDYTAFMKDPDLLVDWELIEEVRAPQAAEARCPICLCPPLAAKVAKCGHAYCHPCALQYIGYENSGRASKKCAICAEHIYPADLRSLRPAPDSGDAVGVGETVTMLLMRRLKGDNRAVPVELLPRLVGEDYDDSERLAPPRLADSLPGVAAFAKLITATPEDVANFVIDRELRELAQLQSDAEPEQLEFVRAAKAATLARLGGGNGHRAGTSAEAALESVSGQLLPPQRLTAAVGGTTSSPAAAAAAAAAPNGSGSGRAEPAPARRAKLTSVSEEPAYYFYQSADGRHVYLHSVNWQCLAWQYGGMANCPTRIEASVLHVEQVSVSPALRKRVAYMRHLPLTCSIAIAELDLGPPLLSRRCLAEFSRQLDDRRRQRQALARQERRLTRQRDAEERRLMGRAMDIVVTASAMNAREPRESPAFTEADPPLSAAAAASPPSTPAAGGDGGGGVRSFAQAAAAWPSKPPPPPSQPPPPAASAVTLDSDGEEVPAAAAPKPLASLGDALGAMLAAATSEGGVGGNGKQQRRGRKKAAKNFLRQQQQQLDEEERRSQLLRHAEPGD